MIRLHAEGKSVHKGYISRAALRIFEILKLEGPFFASPSYVHRFLVRQRWSLRAVKNKKMKSAKDRIPVVTDYFSRLRQKLCIRPPGISLLSKLSIHFYLTIFIIVFTDQLIILFFRFSYFFVFH
jgi:hypothetical protein